MKRASAAAEEAAAKRAAARAARSRAQRSSQEAERDRKRAGEAAARVIELTDHAANASERAEEARASAEDAREESLRLADLAEEAGAEAEKARLAEEEARLKAERSAELADELLEDAQTAICAARDEGARVDRAREEADEAAGRASDAGSASEEAEARAEVLEFEAAEAEDLARKLAAEAAAAKQAAKRAEEARKKREQEKQEKQKKQQEQEQKGERVHDSTVELSAEEAGRLFADRKKGGAAKPKKKSTVRKKRNSGKTKTRTAPAAKAAKPAKAGTGGEATQTARPAGGEISVPGYELLGKMGGDDLGVLYRARQSNMNRLVVLRVLRSDRAYDRPSVDAFLRQSRLAGQFCHANVVRVHELGRSGVLHFCSMEYVEGNTLEKMVAGAGAFEARRACHVVRDLAAALTHWERRKLAYGDLTPARVLLDSGSVPKIAWLGLAAGAGLGTEKVPGRVNFLAPEVLDGESVDPRADIYTLGALLFFTATGKVPHDEDTSEKIVGSAGKGPQFLRGIGDRLPRPVADIVRKAMQPRPEMRYADLAGLIAALDGAVASKAFKRPSAERITPRKVRPAHRRRRRR